MWFTKQEINLIRELTWIEFKLRYNASILGFFWSLLNPLLMLSILYLVFSVLIRNDIAYYPIFLLIGIILWNFFAESTTNSAAIIITKSPLINKIYFKREILVIATCITTFITLLLNLIILGIFMIISKIGFNLVLLYSIFILLNLFLLSLGLSFGLAAFYTKFRDLQHIWRVLLQAGFFITPIIYSVKIIPIKYIKWYMLNPLAKIITTLRETFIDQITPNFNSLIIQLFISLLILTIGYYTFKKREVYFSEEI